MYTMQVLALLALLVGLVRSYSWDIVEGGDNQLQFYFNGTLTHTEPIPSTTMITSVTYDPVHYRVFFVDYKNSNMSISSFDLSTRNIQILITKESGANIKVVYDPITQVLFWKDGPDSIYSFSLNLASSKNAIGGNLLVKLDHVCRDIAVDICGGYIYWITDSEIERARLDGTEREVLIDGSVFKRISLVLDQQTKKMYWFEKTSAENVYPLSIQSANFYGKDRATLYKFSNETSASSLAVSKDTIYWKNDQKEMWQMQKNPSKDGEIKFYSMPSPNCGSCEFISANYTIKEQIQGIESCEAAQQLDPNYWNTECQVSICHNYCLQGNCSVNAEGQPICSCKPGYSGERCEVDVCHKHCLNNGDCSLNEENEPVCQCTAAYEGARCDVSVLKDFCFQAACSVNAEGHPNVTVTLGKAGKSRRNSTELVLEKSDVMLCNVTTKKNGG